MEKLPKSFTIDDSEQYKPIEASINPELDLYRHIYPVERDILSDIQLKQYDALLSDVNKHDAAKRLRGFIEDDTNARDILQITELADVHWSDKVEVIREDADVRALLGKYLEEKLDYSIGEDPHLYGWRLQRNTEKSDDKVTWRHYNSREYAVTLALRMIDGSFSAKLQSPSDPAGKVNERGEMQGQHRDAARRILGLEVI